MSLRCLGTRFAMLAIPSEAHLGIIKTNFQFSKASPFCQSKLYLISLGTCEAAKSRTRQPWWLQSVLSPWLQFDFLWHQKTNYFSEQCSSFSKSKISLLGKGLGHLLDNMSNLPARAETLKVMEEQREARGWRNRAGPWGACFGVSAGWWTTRCHCLLRCVLAMRWHLGVKVMSERDI